MATHRETAQLSIQTGRQQELVDVTQRINEAIEGWDCPAVLVYVPHTTAGVLINEHADPDVARDVLAALDRIVPADAAYRHAEGNAPAHVKAVLVSTSQMVPVTNGRLALGRWQGVFFAEFDGPRSRLMLVVPLETS